MVYEGKCQVTVNGDGTANAKGTGKQFDNYWDYLRYISDAPSPQDEEGHNTDTPCFFSRGVV